MLDNGLMQIDGARLWASIMAVAEIGATEKGGSCRLALTDLDKQCRDLFVSWCRDAGCTIRIDQMGNIFARRAGKDETLPAVATGSHLDTQPTGGRFDGVYGVLAGLEVIRRLNDLAIQTEHPIEVVVWTNEEGSRFAPSMIASGVFGGAFDLDYALACQDQDGKTIAEELVRIGYDGDAPVTGHPLHAYFEAHIEQGPILEAEDVTIGLVTHAQGQRWYEVTLTGQEAHAGPTPMPLRRDALLGAARIVELVNQIGLDNPPNACATCGMLNVFPNSRNVIPGEVFLTVDLRHPDASVLEAMAQRFMSGAEDVAKRGGLSIECKCIFEPEPLAFDLATVDAVRRSIEALDYSYRDIVSGAGHDAVYVARVAPAAMIFIPCIDGISHNEIEDAKPEWVTAGANVLINAMLEKAKIVQE